MTEQILSARDVIVSLEQSRADAREILASMDTLILVVKSMLHPRLPAYQVLEQIHELNHEAAHALGASK
jgi:hypothetical protein